MEQEQIIMHYFFLFNVNQTINEDTDFDTAEQKQGVSAKKLEGLLAEQILLEVVDGMDHCAREKQKHVDIRLVANKDLAWTSIIDEYCTETDDVYVTKVDDVNHALKPTFKCVTEVRISLDADDRSDSGLAMNFARHLHQSAQG